MDVTEAARREAGRIHLAAVTAGDDPWALLDFVKREASRRNLDVYALQPDDPQLKGGRAVFDSQAGIILYELAGTAFDQAFLIAHELGHVVLEGGAYDWVTEQVEPDRSIEDTPVGVEKVLDYGSRERREIRMDLFARELLLPRSVARHLHLANGLSSLDIATRLGAPLPVVQQQLLDALLLPIEAVEPESPEIPLAAPTTPDSSQVAAVAHRDSPFQLQAGPGTGKTRTLVNRIESLLSDGVDPKSILVLTFSNKAANELSERLAISNPAAATAMWIGTFHAFGLDIIHRFHDRLGFPPNPRLIDRLEAIELLEHEIQKLPLKHYRNLWDPTLVLNDILNAISRAKDEVVDAAGYMNLARSMGSNPHNDEDAVMRAEKCLEVAFLFETYERLMTSRQLIDFGDLVATPVKLVETDIEVRAALKLRHQHVLVDEYQDVNRASVRLLKAIVEDGRNLWVVGDTRQSIYRFRGASSANMACFAEDFPGAKICQLGVNYRSAQEIVDVFTTFSNTMKASEGALPLQLAAHRGMAGITPEFLVANSTEDEISAVAAVIRSQHQAGISYRNQALLCASNSRLSEFASGLEARGIPVLHLGSFFERPEIKNLLALLSLLTDSNAAGLIRASTMVGHEIELQDVANIIKHLRDSQTAALHWATPELQLSELNPDTLEALARLSELFAGLNPAGNPWEILATWVIDRLALAKTLHLAGDAKSRMQSLALWQFMNFCRNQPKVAGNPSLRLLDRIRRLVLLSEDRALRQLPKSAEGIDAVRLMTIHASKGLEFDVLHLPGMVASGLPRSNKPPACVPPDGLIYGTDGLTGLEAVKAGHDAEEECLFFVALSRARNKLFLYASSVMANGNTRRPSKFIPSIKHHLICPSQPTLYARQIEQILPIEIAWDGRNVWTDTQIKLFERCPRRFLYTHVLKLGARSTEETAFMKMHSVVRDVLDWLRVEHETANPAEVELVARYNEVWQLQGATDHGYAEDYCRIGWRLVEFLAESRSTNSRAEAKPISLSLPEADILVQPDEIVHSEHGKVALRRVKTGKLGSNAFDDIEYTILHLAAVQAYGAQAQVEVAFLTSEKIEQMSISAQKLSARREKLQSFVKDVHRGEFPAKADARSCPRCPNFFVCGDLPSGAITIKNI